MTDDAYAGALTAYRIVRAGYPLFDGGGAARWGGRWTSPGRAVIHAAETYALAVLENLVHFNASELPPNMVAIQIDIPKGVSREIIHRADVPEFDTSSTYNACRVIGDRWHKSGKSAILIVPSRLSPFECNMLIHPAHKDVSTLHIGDPFPARLDERLRALVKKTGQERKTRT